MTININRVFDLCYFKMCFCDGYSFLVINKNTKEKYFIQGDENMVEFFQNHNGTAYPPTPTRIVNVSKCNLLKDWALKIPGYGESVLKNTGIYYTMKDDKN